MLLKDNKKGLVTIIMKRMKSPNMESGYESCEEAPMEDGAQQDNSDAMKAASESLISAVHAKDAVRLQSALRSLISMIEDESESEED